MKWIKAFISGFLATLIFHQGLFALLWWVGVLPKTPYNLSPVPPFGIPAVISLSFFGGLWGILLWALLGKLSGLTFWLSHFAVGAIGPTAIAMWVVFPAKGIGVSVMSWMVGLLLNGFWGIGVAVCMRIMKEKPVTEPPANPE